MKSRVFVFVSLSCIFCAPMTSEDNADAHLKRQIMGREVVVAITNGKLDFGPWEQIFYGEFDGQRNKRVLVKVIGE
ncbi:MAG: YjbQ family protein [Candidatus Nitrosopolaris sp.]|jgi:secondary thiamine-phosphate synthase enzyme